MRGGSWTRVSKFGPALTVSFTFLAAAVLGGAFAVQGSVQGGMYSESIASAKLAAATSAASTSRPDVNVVFARGTLGLPGLTMTDNAVPYAQAGFVLCHR